MSIIIRQDYSRGIPQFTDAMQKKYTHLTSVDVKNGIRGCSDPRWVRLKPVFLSNPHAILLADVAAVLEKAVLSSKPR